MEPRHLQIYELDTGIFLFRNTFTGGRPTAQVQFQGVGRGSVGWMDPAGRIDTYGHQVDAHDFYLESTHGRAVAALALVNAVRRAEGETKDTFDSNQVRQGTWKLAAQINKMRSSSNGTFEISTSQVLEELRSLEVETPVVD